MFINNRLASLIYKVAIILVCLIGLVMSSGLSNGTFAPYVLLYYTIESNLLCLVFYVVAVVVTGLNIKKTGRYGAIRFASHFKGAAVMAMLLTFVLQFLVSDSVFHGATAGAVIANVISHWVVPFMVLIDWCLFDRKGRFVASDPIIWMAIPFIYYSIVLLAAQLDVMYPTRTYYPYTIIDPEIIGWAPVLVNLFLIVGGYLAVGYILFGVDRGLGSYARKKALEAAHNLPELEESGEDEVPEELQDLQDILHASNLGGQAETAAPAVAAAGVAAVPEADPTAARQPLEESPAEAPPTTVTAPDADLTAAQRPLGAPPPNQP